MQHGSLAAAGQAARRPGGGRPGGKPARRLSRLTGRASRLVRFVARGGGLPQQAARHSAHVVQRAARGAGGSPGPANGSAAEPKRDRERVTQFLPDTFNVPHNVAIQAVLSRYASGRTSCHELRQRCLSHRAYLQGLRAAAPSCVSAWPVGPCTVYFIKFSRSVATPSQLSQTRDRARCEGGALLHRFVLSHGHGVGDGELRQGEDLRAPRGEHHHRWQQRFRCPEVLLPRVCLRRRPGVYTINSPATSARSSGTCLTGSRMSPPCLPAPTIMWYTVPPSPWPRPPVSLAPPGRDLQRGPRCHVFP